MLNGDEFFLIDLCFFVTFSKRSSHHSAHFTGSAILLTNSYSSRNNFSLNSFDSTTLSITFAIDFGSLENGKKLNITAIGGSLIGLSGMILYLNNQRTIDEEITLDEFEEFADRTKSNSDLAFIFLTLGGFLIAIDNFN